MKYMGAGALLHGLVLPACKRSNEYLVPYNNSPEWTLPGISTAYSTCMPGIYGATPLLAICREGRPLKLEPQSWLTESMGLSTFVQASILGLYDPKRSKRKLFNGKPVPNEEFTGAFAAWARKVQSNGRVGFVFGENDSPLRQQMMAEIKRRNPNARFFSWEPLSRRNALLATEQAFEKGVVQVAKFSQTKRILSLDCDFLAHDIQGYTGDFMKGRIPEGLNYQYPEGDYTHLNRLYMAEGRFSMTGGLADERLSILPSRIACLLWSLAREVGRLTQTAALQQLPEPGIPLKQAEQEWLQQCAEDLCANRGQSLVLLGSQYPVELHRMVLAINSALNATGITLHFLKSDADLCEPLSGLPEAVAQGQIETLFFLCAANPLQDAPASWGLKEALKTPGLTSVRLGLYVDETSQACTWHIPAAHYLESWGVERDLLGRYCYRQPVVTPLYEGVAEEELLNGLLHSRGLLVTSPASGDRPSPVYQRARRCFDQIAKSGDKESAWADALRTGYSSETAFARIVQSPREPDQQLWATCLEWSNTAPPDPAKGEFEIQFVADYSVFDGRYANNEWLRELPDPVAGLCWDAPAQMSRKTAALLAGVNQKKNPVGILDIAHPNGQSSFISCPIPGMPDGLVVIPLGYGAGHVAFEAKGLQANAYALRNRSDMVHKRINVEKLSICGTGKHPVAIMLPAVNQAPPVPILPANKPPVRKDQPASIAPRLSSDPLHQWGMNIDLSLCIGCNACLIACQAENNIPVVGPEQIAAGRIMHWIRIDRYFIQQENRGKNSSPLFLAQPVACQQCESAPCESVCPVNATTHTSEGLNAMVYPRCWGTRYCAANCPYKARRFNFLDYAKQSGESTRLQRNPHVTVRSRGVMEKCTYCVQRIEDVKVRHKAAVMAGKAAGNSTGLELDLEELRLPPNAVKTACQLACPAGAITFGNLLQKDTVVEAKNSSRNVVALEQLGTRPRTSYLAKIHNSSQGDHQ